MGRDDLADAPAQRRVRDDEGRARAASLRGSSGGSATTTAAASRCVGVGGDLPLQRLVGVGRREAQVEHETLQRWRSLKLISRRLLILCAALNMRLPLSNLNLTENYNLLNLKINP